MSILRAVTVGTPYGLGVHVVGGVPFRVASISDINIRSSLRVTQVIEYRIRALICMYVSLEGYVHTVLIKQCFQIRFHLYSLRLISMRDVGVVPRAMHNSYKPRCLGLVNALEVIKSEGILGTVRIAGAIAIQIRKMGQSYFKRIEACTVIILC